MSVFCCSPGDRGPQVVAVSFARGGEMHETLTFHKAGKFFAHVLLNPRAHGLTVPQQTIPLGFHTAGSADISFRLGTLKPGRYAVVVTPQHVTEANAANQATTWVYFTIKPNGKFTDIKLVNF